MDVLGCIGLVLIVSFCLSITRLRWMILCWMRNFIVLYACSYWLAIAAFCDFLGGFDVLVCGFVLHIFDYTLCLLLVMLWALGL